MKKWIVTYYDTNSNRVSKNIVADTASEADEKCWENTKDYSYSVSVVRDRLVLGEGDYYLPKAA